MYRTVDCSTWDDPWFADLAPMAKLVFLYLFTNRRVTQCGAMEITMRQISFETGINSADIPSLIDALGDRVHWWPESNLLIVRNFYRHQRAKTGDKFDIAARKSAELLPEFAQSWLYGVYPHLAPEGYSHPKPMDTHPIPTPVPPPSHGISEQSSNRDKNRAGDENPPTVDAPQAPRDTPIEPKRDDGPKAKPPSPKRAASDALYERRMPIFEAFLRGLNIAPDSLAATQRKGPSLQILTTAILDAPDCTPEVIEPLTRYAAAAFKWRQGRSTPSLAEVLAALPEWEAAGRPNEPPPKKTARLPDALQSRVDSWTQERTALGKSILPYPAQLQAAIDDFLASQNGVRT